MTFTKSNAYTARNTRTGETFTVTCTHNGINGVTFVDANGNTFKCFKQTSAYSDTVMALDVRKRVSIKAA